MGSIAELHDDLSRLSRDSIELRSRTLNTPAQKTAMDLITSHLIAAAELARVLDNQSGSNAPN